MPPSDEPTKSFDIDKKLEEGEYQGISQYFLKVLIAQYSIPN